MTLDFSGHTNGFVEQDEVRLSMAAQELAASFSVAFADTPGTFECTATVNTSAPAAADSYYALISVYAAAQPEIVAGPTVMGG
jgi:hypothetical protein